MLKELLFVFLYDYAACTDFLFYGHMACPCYAESFREEAVSVIETVVSARRNYL